MIAAIVAVDENWGIGRNGDLLINIPEDKKFFKERTNGSIVIMGRKTWDSLPKKPLPNRKNYVISKSQKHVNGVDFISMDSAIELIQNEEASKYFDAEIRFNVLIADVNKIIGNVVQELLK